MHRRDFVKTSLLTGAAAATSQTVFAHAEKKYAADKPFNLDYAPHEGMFKNMGGADFIDQIKFAYDKGFRSIEDNGMTSRSPEMQKKIGDTLARLGMRMGVFVVPKGGNSANSLAAGKQEYIDIFLKGCRSVAPVP